MSCKLLPSLCQNAPSYKSDLIICTGFISIWHTSQKQDDLIKKSKLLEKLVI